MGSCYYHNMCLLCCVDEPLYYQGKPQNIHRFSDTWAKHNLLLTSFPTAVTGTVWREGIHCHNGKNRREVNLRCSAFSYRLLSSDYFSSLLYFALLPKLSRVKDLTGLSSAYPPKEKLKKAGACCKSLFMCYSNRQKLFLHWKQIHTP